MLVLHELPLFTCPHSHSQECKGIANNPIKITYSRLRADVRSRTRRWPYQAIEQGIPALRDSYLALSALFLGLSYSDTTADRPRAIQAPTLTEYTQHSTSTAVKTTTCDSIKMRASAILLTLATSLSLGWAEQINMHCGFAADNTGMIQQPYCCRDMQPAPNNAKANVASDCMFLWCCQVILQMTVHVLIL